MAKAIEAQHDRRVLSRVYADLNGARLRIRATHMNWVSQCNAGNRADERAFRRRLDGEENEE